MPTNDEQLAFLLCCLKHGNITSGQIPFDKVIEELEIPTIGAAQKRWSRLMQSLRESAAKVGNDGSAGDGKKTKTKQAKVTKPKATKAAAGGKGNVSKKRKVEEKDEDSQDDADFKDEDSEA